MQTGARPAESDAAAPAGQVRSGASGSAPLRAGSFAGPFLLEEPIHSGALATVWKGRDRSGAPIALKLARDDGSERARAARRLLEREFDVLSRLRHPHIVPVEHWLGSADAAGFAMAYLGGGDLVSLAGSAPRIWAGLVGDLIAALGAVHERGFVHRDVKARNVMLDCDDRVRLIDFGSCLPAGAVWSAAGTTAEHRPPEPDASGAVQRIVHARDDIYALAVLILELTNGSVPRAETRSAAARAPLPGLARPRAARELADLAHDTVAIFPRLPGDRLSALAAAVETLREAEDSRR